MYTHVCTQAYTHAHTYLHMHTCTQAHSYIHNVISLTNFSCVFKDLCYHEEVLRTSNNNYYGCVNKCLQKGTRVKPFYALLSWSLFNRHLYISVLRESFLYWYRLCKIMTNVKSLFH